MDVMAYKALAASLRPAISQGITRLLITSSAPLEGKSTVSANLARTLADSGESSVLLIDTDLLRPAVHKQFGKELGRGLSELMKEVYHVDLLKENPDQFGLGDWVELLRAQSRTGTLRITDGEDELAIMFAKGRISSIYSRLREGDGRLGSILVASGQISAEQRELALRVHQEGQRRFGDVLRDLGYLGAPELESALLTQLRQSLQKLVTLPRPHYEFQEVPKRFASGASGAGGEMLGDSIIDHYVFERFSDYLKSPFLGSQIPSYFADTELDSLKLLTRGQGACEVSDPAFPIFLQRVARSFDVVLMDAPPVAVTSPARALASIAQGVLFVVKSEGYDLRIVQQAKDHLVEAGANVLGVVLNQVNVKSDPRVAYYYGAYRR